MTDLETAQAWAAWFAAERDQQAREHQTDLAAISLWQRREIEKNKRLRALADEWESIGLPQEAWHIRIAMETDR